MDENTHMTTKALWAVGWHEKGAVYVMNLYDMMELNRQAFIKGERAWTILETFKTNDDAVAYKATCIKVRRELRKTNPAVGPETIGDALEGISTKKEG